MTEPPARRLTAHRPLLAPTQGKRALVQLGGAVETSGERALASRLAQAWTVEPGERDATLTHPFHAYPARLHPTLAEVLLALGAEVQNAAELKVLDPFCGSGTVLVEALVAGHRAWGSDLSAFAVELAALKTRRTRNEERKAMVTTAHRLVRTTQEKLRARERLPESMPAAEREWYAPAAWAEVSWLAAGVQGLEPGFPRDALRMALSSVLVRASKQRSETDPRKEEKAPLPHGVAHLFGRKAMELARCLAGFASALPEGPSRVTLEVEDAAALGSVAEGSIDLVVTSPPYAGTYDYSAHHARRTAALGLDASALEKGELGAARGFERDPRAAELRFEEGLGAAARALGRVLRPGGLALVVLGDGASERGALRAELAVEKAAQGSGLTVRARASQERRSYDERSARAFRGAPRREHLFALGRSP